MKFVCQLFKRLNLLSPSLKQLRDFKLPGFVSPKKVRCFVYSVKSYINYSAHACFIQFYSTRGVPFYMNSPIEIVRRCIGNPRIATALFRYPVANADPIR